MEWLIENWFIVVGVLALATSFGFVIVNFLGLPTQKQVEKVKEWLLWSVTEAEKELGGQTGKLKLSKVYDKFIAKFPMTAMFVSFETFSKYVDLALVEMKKLLETNEAIKQYVENK